MITAGEIYEYIDSIAPFETAMSFDNVGLLVGSEETITEKVLVSLDVSSKTLQEANEIGARIIVSHHPIIFNPLKKLLSDSVPYKAASLGITVISAHTNLDIAECGVNNTLADRAGVIYENGTDSSCHLFGRFSKEYDEAEELADDLCCALRCKGVRFTERNGKIRSVCIACGAGGDSIFAAAAKDVDAVITGEIKHHELLYAMEKNIAVFDVGHYYSEALIVDVLVKRLSERFRNVDFIASKTGGDGIEYYKR